MVHFDYDVYNSRLERYEYDDGIQITEVIHPLVIPVRYIHPEG